MALKIDTIIDILRGEKIPPHTLVAIETKLETIEQEQKEERSAGVGGTKQKNEFVIVVRGDANLKKILQQGWVVQVPQGYDIQALPVTMKVIAENNNKAQVRKKNPIKLWREFFMYVKRKFAKEKDVLVKTKSACQVVVLESEEI